MKDFIKFQSDIEPDTYLRMTLNDSGDITLQTFTQGITSMNEKPFEIIGYGGGGRLNGVTKTKVIKAFRNLFNILLNAQKTENQKPVFRKFMFGRNIKRKRLEIGFTQEKLAQLVGLSRFAITSYENGHSNPSIKSLAKIAQVLNTNVSELLKEEQSD